MKYSSYQLPGQVKYKNHFLDHCNVLPNRENITAISNCYANYKVLGVFYSPDIMQLIYDFDKQFPLGTDCHVKVTGNNNEVEKEPETKVEKEPETKVEFEYYRPKNYEYAKSRFNLKFINFVKATNVFHLSENSNKIIDSVMKEEGNVINVDHCLDKELSNETNERINGLIRFKSALEMEKHKANLERFRRDYIRIKIIEASLCSTKDIIQAAAEKSQQRVKFKIVKTTGKVEFRCDIVFNDEVLLGESYQSNPKLAIQQSIDLFHKECIKDIDLNKYLEEKKLCNPPELESDEDEDDDDDDDDNPSGGEFYELPILEDFYLRNNRSGTATGILLESFQFFRMTISFTETDGKIILLVDGTPLASMNFHGCNALSKLRLSRFALRRLQKSKWTLMRNTLYINDFNESINVEKTEMYEKNLKDPTKIKSQSNIGGKLMLKMGWDENSGLGKSGSGMKEPIINQMNAKRQGIGFDLGSSKDIKSFCNNVSKTLRSWIAEGDDDLVFDRQFDNKERAIIHKECRKLGLLSKSYNNTNGDRFLVVSSCRNPKDLFQWVQSKGGKTKLYTLVPPGTFSSKSPDL